MTKEELTRLKSQLAKAIDEVVDGGAIMNSPMENLGAVITRE